MKQLLIDIKNIFENINVESWTCKTKIEIDLKINWVNKSTNAKKKFLLVILLLTLLKNVFFLFWTIVVCSICSNFWFLVIAFFSVFLFFKAIEFEALNFEVFTSNLYFFLIMFRLMKWTRNQKISNRVNFRFVEKIETLFDLTRSNFSTMKKLVVLITSTKAVDLIYWNMLWIDMCFKSEIKSVFVEIVDFNCRLSFRIR